jgi:segregation and condensation protein B
MLLLGLARRRYSARMQNQPQADEPPAEPGALNAEEVSAGMSLQALSQAFSAIERPSGSAVAEGDGQRAAQGTETEKVTPGQIVEAVLFVGRPDNQPLESRAIAAIMGSISPPEVESLVAELNAEYAANGCPYTIASEGAGFRLVLRSELSAVRDRYQRRIRAARLSPAAIEVLAMVAYRGPLTADEISRQRGTPSGPVLRQLVQRQLLRIERRNETPRKAVYHTTERFLAVFGLASLGDLPKSE